MEKKHKPKTAKVRHRIAGKLSSIRVEPELGLRECSFAITLLAALIGTHVELQVNHDSLLVTN